MSVTEHHIRLDYHRLSSQYQVELTHNNRRLIINNYDYPVGWQPSPAPLLIRYPQHYPQMQPAIYLPKALTYTRGRVHHHFRRGTLADGDQVWVRWCTHKLPWRNDIEHFLTNWIRPSLANPETPNPVKHE